MWVRVQLHFIIFLSFKFASVFVFILDFAYTWIYFLNFESGMLYVYSTNTHVVTLIISVSRSVHLL